MDNKELKIGLFIPFHKLCFMENIDNFCGFEKWQKKGLKMEHATEEIERTY